ncbi:hypothetical protein FKM82_030846 [Ascaphus truei]
MFPHQKTQCHVKISSTKETGRLYISFFFISLSRSGREKCSMTQEGRDSPSRKFFPARRERETRVASSIVIDMIETHTLREIGWKCAERRSAGRERAVILAACEGSADRSWGCRGRPARTRLVLPRNGRLCEHNSAAQTQRQGFTGS